jgi:tetratricopeptide (TPR) repeat protein
MLRVALPLVMALALSSAPAFAQRPAFWERVADPHREQIEALVMRAQAELGERGGAGQGEAAARAEAWLREALRLDGRNFVAAVLLGEASARQRRGDEAVRQFQRARSLARTPTEESWCTLRVAVESSRAGRYPEALGEYDRHIRLGEAQAAAYANSAEILMALGRLGEAEDRYREAIRLEAQEQPGRERDENLALAFYGLGVALDRDEQTAAAREAVARALALDAKMELLDAAQGSEKGEKSEVFFVPPGDVHYYRGLALLVAGRAQEAADAFQRFLGEQRGGRFGPRAEAHLLALSAKAEGARVTRLRVAAAATVWTKLGFAERSPSRGGMGTLPGSPTPSVRADETLPAALVDAAWRARPGLVDACLEELPAAARTPGRIGVDIEFDRTGAAQRVTVDGRDDLGGFPACVEARVKAAVHVPRPGEHGASARVELVLAVRR